MALCASMFREVVIIIRPDTDVVGKEIYKINRNSEKGRREEKKGKGKLAHRFATLSIILLNVLHT
jgi:uncharacterized protein Veg